VCAPRQTKSHQSLFLPLILFSFIAWERLNAKRLQHMPFYAPLGRLIKRQGSRSRSGREDILSSLPRGEVKKLVLDGAWRDRRWNTRWLEVSVPEKVLTPRELLYYKEEGRDLIHRIDAQHISEVRTLTLRVDEVGLSEYSTSDNGIGQSERPSLWSTVMNNCQDVQEMQCCFLVSTDPLRNGRGKEYLFKTKSVAEAEGWVRIIENMMLSVQPLPTTCYSIFRSRVRAAYQSQIFQIVVALMIFVNLLVNVVASQNKPEPGTYLLSVLNGFDIALTVFFSFELALNAFTSNSVDEFCGDPWNW
jgi:hypothetical protein